MRHGRVFLPKTNSRYWATKLRGNRQRFLQQARLLRRAGWNVLVIWQCELKGSPDAVVAKIRVALRHR